MRLRKHDVQREYYHYFGNERTDCEYAPHWGAVLVAVYSFQACGRASAECMGRELAPLNLHSGSPSVFMKAHIETKGRLDMTSVQMRKDQKFLRGGFPCEGEFEMPIIKKAALPDGAIDLIACSRTRPNDTEENRRKGVHFFVDDYRFDVLRRKPDAGLEKYRQYAFVLSPDFSRYNEMPVWKVIEAVGMNRWMGSYWQKQGLRVIPSVGWATPFTYRFCFLGVERHSPVAVTTNGNRRFKREYLHGYDAMLERLEPSAIICLGNPFPEMRGNIIPVKYEIYRKER